MCYIIGVRREDLLRDTGKEVGMKVLIELTLRKIVIRLTVRKR